MARCIFQIICILIIHLWVSPVTTSNTSENAPDCISSIMVPRNTVWKAQVMDNLMISCTIDTESHCWKDITVTWCKIKDKNVCRPLNHSNNTTTQWGNITESRRLLLLIFHNVSMQDAGLYRCEILSPTPTVSHAINVTVTDYVPDYATTDFKVTSQDNNTRNSSNLNVRPKEWLMSYVYIGSGIGVLLIILVIVSVIVIRCRVLTGQKRSLKEKIHENQSTATPVSDLTPPVYKPRETPRIKTQTLPAQLSPPPPSIYDTPPVRVMSLRDRSSAGRHPVNHGPPRRCHNRDSVEEVEEEDPLIYATLNHEAVPQRPVRVAHVQIEASEYAAIKVT